MQEEDNNLLPVFTLKYILISLFFLEVFDFNKEISCIKNKKEITKEKSEKT